MNNRNSTHPSSRATPRAGTRPPSPRDQSTLPLTYVLDDFLLTTCAPESISDFIIRSRNRQRRETGSTLFVDDPANRIYVCRWTPAWTPDVPRLRRLYHTIKREHAELQTKEVIDKSRVVMSQASRMARDDPNTWDFLFSTGSLLASCMALDALADESSLEPYRRASNITRLRELQVRETHHGGRAPGIWADLLDLRHSLVQEVGPRTRYITETERQQGFRSASLLWTPPNVAQVGRSG